MAEFLPHAILSVVCLLLAIGLIRQFSVMGSKAALLDQLAIIPQWKFFAHHGVDGDETIFDDPHIVARIGRADGSGDWQEIWSAPHRTMRSTVWNCGLRRETLIVEALLLLVRSDDGKQPPILPTGLAYLTILRLCMDGIQPQSGEIIQFAIAMARNPEDRAISLRFLSSWHSR